MTTHQPVQGAFWMVAAGSMFAIINTTLQYLGMNYGVSSSAAVLLQYGIALFLFLPLMRTGSIRWQMPHLCSHLITLSCR